ncbi:precorrin-6A reductase [Proteocatella sphenisci]|uniref:precorrin-6A reductase n=1 Tax=Proteocatella sphenisci TaxID=181070 RepID=UPI00048EF846|nr:precorrin-6A reductase [Proteocatella sphenisci]
MKAFVFAGTTEGREAAVFLAQRGIDTRAFTATDYGLEVLSGAARGLDNIVIESGRLSEDEISSMLLECKDAKIVIDATHPYATQVTQNIRKACMDTDTRYIRVLRKSTFTETSSEEFGAESGFHEGITVLSDAQAVCDWANLEENTGKKILLTTGSKDLKIYSQIKNYSERVYPRILSDLDSLANAIELGYKKSNIICMQGPFSVEMNMALIEATGANVLVTKDTGAAGGFDSKLEAAALKGIEALVIGRPADENGNAAESEGLSPEEFRNYIDEHFPLFPHFPMFVSLAGKKVTVVGAGKIGARRIKVLVEYGASIRVIAPGICDEIRALVNENLEIIGREYRSGDLEGSFMVIAATDKREVNKMIGNDAKKIGAQVSVADSREECSFYFPAVIRNGSISIGLVSDGRDHAAAAKTARELREYFKVN